MTNSTSVKILEDPISSKTLFELVSESDLVIAMRLHAIITAATLDTPVIAVNYHPKVESFMELIGALDWMIELDQPSSDRLESLAKMALAGAYPRDQVRANIGKMKKLAYLNAKIAAELLRSTNNPRFFFSKFIRAVSVLLMRISYKR